MTRKQTLIYEFISSQPKGAWVSPTAIAIALDYPQAGSVIDALVRMVLAGILEKNSDSHYRLRAPK